MRINLLPPEYRPQPAVNPKRLFLVILLILLCFTTFSYLGYRYAVLQGKTRALAQLEVELTFYRHDLNEYQALTQYRTGVEQHQAALEQIQATYLTPRIMIGQIAAVMPLDLWLTELDFQQKTGVKLIGQCLSLPVIATFLNQLVSIEGFGSVFLQAINEERTATGLTLYAFTIEVTGLEGAEVHE